MTERPNSREELQPYWTLDSQSVTKLTRAENLPSLAATVCPFWRLRIVGYRQITITPTLKETTGAKFDALDRR